MFLRDGVWPPRPRPRRVQMAFPVSGAAAEGVAYIVARKVSGKYDFKLLAVELRGPAAAAAAAKAAAVRCAQLCASRAAAAGGAAVAQALAVAAARAAASVALAAAAAAAVTSRAAARTILFCAFICRREVD